MTDLISDMKSKLRDERLKDGTDYVILKKYGCINIRSRRTVV